MAQVAILSPSLFRDFSSGPNAPTHASPSSLICSAPPWEPTGTDQGLPSALGTKRSRNGCKWRRERVHWRSTPTGPLGAPLTTPNLLLQLTAFSLRASWWV